MSEKVKVFASAPRGEWFKNAVVGFHERAEPLYSNGYHDAAEILVREALEGYYPDRLIYPICFLYRHSLEITLKDLIRRTEELIAAHAYFDDDGFAEHVRTEGQISSELERTHSLKQLLDLFESRARIAMPECELPAGVRDAILELHEVDQNGERFRYARKRRAGGPMFNQQQAIDIQRLSDALGEAFKFLSWGADAEIGMRLDYLSEYAAELRRAM